MKLLSLMCLAERIRANTGPFQRAEDLDATLHGKVPSNPSCCTCEACIRCSSMEGVSARRLSAAEGCCDACGYSESVPAPTPELPAWEPKPHNNEFKVVVFSTLEPRTLFQKAVAEFICPPEAATAKWDWDTNDTWWDFKDFILEFGSDWGVGLPLLAMNGDSACAAAIIDDETYPWVLAVHMRNAGDACIGGGAALLCYAIRHSREPLSEKYRPVQIQLVVVDEKLQQYYESFGCKAEGNRPGLLPSCIDPDPQGCARYDSKGVDAEKYYPESMLPEVDDEDVMHSDLKDILTIPLPTQDPTEDIEEISQAELENSLEKRMAQRLERLEEERQEQERQENEAENPTTTEFFDDPVAAFEAIERRTMALAAEVMQRKAANLEQDDLPPGSGWKRKGGAVTPSPNGTGPGPAKRRWTAV